MANLRVYEVEFENERYLGEENKTFSVIARGITEAESKSINCLKKYHRTNLKNWRTLRVELLARIDD